MDLESYALTAAQDLDRSSNESAERLDVKGKGKQREQQDVTATGLAREAGEKEEDVTLEADVKHLANSVSSWWSGFSKRTQEQLASAQSHISEQGGIVQFARNEAARIEKSIEEVRREGLAKQRQQEQEKEVAAAPSAANDEGGDGEGKARSSETASAVDASAEERTTTASTTSLPLPSSNPQIAHLQSQITTRLSTLFSTTSSSPSTNLTHSVQTALADVSTSLKQLGGPESKALAQRYLEASRELVGKAGDEWRDMVGELVRVVPPGEGEKGQGEGEGDAVAATAMATSGGREKASFAAAEAGAEKTKVAAAASSDEHTPVHASSASASALQPPPSEQKDEDAFSWEDGGDDGSHSRDSSAGKRSSPPASASASAGKDVVAEKEKANEKAKAAEESDDSDWE